MLLTQVKPHHDSELAFLTNLPTKPQDQFAGLLQKSQPAETTVEQMKQHLLTHKTPLHNYYYKYESSVSFFS